MVQRVEVLTLHMKVWWLEFAPRSPSKNERRKPTPQSCPLTSNVYHAMCSHTYNMHTTEGEEEREWGGEGGEGGARGRRGGGEGKGERRREGGEGEGRGGVGCVPECVQRPEIRCPALSMIPSFLETGSLTALTMPGSRLVVSKPQQFCLCPP